MDETPTGSAQAAGPLVSVIIPAYNAEAFIGATLDSVLSQTYRSLEVVVVDDGSSDGTERLVRVVAERDPRVRLLRQPNGGVARARNFGIQSSSGDYVAPLDADDIWFPDKLARQVECLGASGPEVGVVYCGSAYIDAAGELTGSYCFYTVEGDVLLPLVYRNFIGNASTPLIRRSSLDEAGLYDPELRARKAEGLEDWELYLRLAEVCEFRVTPQLLVGYRQTRESMSSDFAVMQRSHRIVMEAVRERHPEVPARLVRWSAAELCLHFSFVAGSRQSDSRLAFYWAWQALRQDRLMILQQRFHRCLLRALGAAVRRPLARLGVPVGRQRRRWTLEQLMQLSERLHLLSIDPYLRRVARARRSIRQPGCENSTNTSQR
jgi:glycosyltransferase involved in cell wall biosynthesis